MAGYQDDSSDEEMRMNLQLAERLSINRGDHASSNNKGLSRKERKNLCNQRKKQHFLDEQSSSSSSFEMHNELSLSKAPSIYSLHNKKRQNGDKITEQLANPKRTCLSDRLVRSHGARDHKSKANGETSHSSKMVNFPPQSTNPSIRNLFPDSTYEDHLNNFSDEEEHDFQPWRPFAFKKKVLDTDDSSSTVQNFGQSSSSLQPSVDENQEAVSQGVQFIDSSDEDSRTVMQNGALKGGRQSPEPMSFKKVIGRLNKQVIDSDSPSDESEINWTAKYHSRPLRLSSDSDEPRPSNKITKKPADTTLKKSANLSFPSGDSYKSNHDHMYHRSGVNFAEPFSNDELSNLEPTTSSYKGKGRANKSYKTRSSSRAERMAELDADFEFPTFHPKDYRADVGESQSRGPSIPHSRNLRSHRRDECSKSPKSRSLIGANSPKGKAHHSHHQDFLEAEHHDRNSVLPSHPSSSDFYPREGHTHPLQGMDFHPIAEEESSSRRRVPSIPRAPRNHRSVNSSKAAKGRTLPGACSRKGKFNLATMHPDLFDAEDSSEVEFFTANSYSDTESNTESLNSLRRINPMHRHTPVHITETNCDSVNVGSSEDEISVVFTSGPHPRTSEPRRGTSTRTLGRRGNRGSRRHVVNTQDVVSLSPDPVEQVRQMEEDERFARLLQAQFDAEVDPTYTPRTAPYMHPPPEPCLAMRDSSSEDSVDLHMDGEFNPHDRSERFLAVSHPFSILPTVLPRRGGYRARRPRRRTDTDPRFNIARLFDLHTDIHFAPMGNLFNYESSDDSYEAFLGIADLNGDVTHGLQKSEINRLPTRKYLAPNTSSSSNGSDLPHKRAELNKECQVCLSDYANGDVLRILPCFHEFHTPCIDPWLKINHTCPVCRVIVDLGE